MKNIAELERDLSVRIGIATGMVVVGDIVGEGASQEAAITGETPNLAARLQEIAEPNTVVIAQTTHTLAGGMFETTDYGVQVLKGFTDPVRVWSVSDVRKTESRFDATRAEHLTELIGRDEEMEILLRRWGKAKAGDGQVVLISGEPGIGKSRIVQELQDRIAGEDYYRLRHQCSPYHTNSALHPVIEQLGRAAGLELEDGTEARLDKLEALLALSGQPVEHAAPLIASLLSLSTGGRYTPLNFTPQRQKELTLQALVDQISGLAERQPLLLVFEDAHWIDPTTLELLELAVEHVLDIPVLMLVTYRPEFGAPWIGQSHVTQVGLNRLGYASWFMAENEVAENGFRKAVDLYDPVLHAKRADAYYGGYDLGVMAYCYLALCQFSLGYPDQAKVTFERAVDHARKLKRINRPPTARVLRVTSLTRLEYANAATHCMRSTR